MKTYKNPNVVLYVVGSVLQGVGQSICWNVMLSPLLFLLTSSTLYVGYAEGLQGLAGALLSVPAGFIADKKGRMLVARFGLSITLVSFVSIAVSVWLQLLAPSLSNFSLYWIFFAIAGLQGLGNGVASGPLQALFNDSIPTGDRSKYNLAQRLCFLVGMVTGPVAALIMLHVLPDKKDPSEWTVGDIRIPFTVGMGFYTASQILYCFMSDSKALQRVADDIASEYVRKREEKTCGKLDSRHVPWLCVIGDLMFGLASGMTVKFFPLWLMNEVKLTNVELNATISGQMGAVGLFSLLATWVAGSPSKQGYGLGFGRIQSILLFKGVGLSLFLAIVVGKNFYWDIKGLMATLHVLRSGTMNASPSIMTAILNDFVPKEKRGRWNSVDMITSFGWSGSALLGGFLLDKIDYQYTFAITFGLQCLALTPYMLLLFLIPKEEISIADAQQHSSAELQSDVDPMIESESLLDQDIERKIE